MLDTESHDFAVMGGSPQGRGVLSSFRITVVGGAIASLSAGNASRALTIVATALDGEGIGLTRGNRLTHGPMKASTTQPRRSLLTTTIPLGPGR